MATEKGERNRERIVEAANALFYRQGFAETSFADVARESGVPKGNFYFYFRSKDDLLRAVVEDRHRRFAALLESWERDMADPRDRLFRFLEIPWRDWPDVVRYGCPMGSLAMELGKGRPELQTAAAAMFEVSLKWSERQFRALGHQPEEARALARALLVRMQGAALLAYTYGDESWIADEFAALRRWLEETQPAS